MGEMGRDEEVVLGLVLVLVLVEEEEEEADECAGIPSLCSNSMEAATRTHDMT